MFLHLSILVLTGIMAAIISKYRLHVLRKPLAKHFTSFSKPNVRMVPSHTSSYKIFSRHDVCFARNMFLGSSASYPRQYSTTSATTEKPVSSDEFRLIYEGPLSQKIKFIKLFSLSTSFLAVFAAPVFILQGKESVPVIGKMILATTVVTMGVTTTILLHWLSRVYVHKMYFHPHSRTFAAETLNFFGRKKTKTFLVEDITVPEIENAFSTFEANGCRYFIHTDLKEAEQVMKYVKEYNYENM
ncbi:transmembrane protein 70, mitochondrial-like [Hydractinia symbiolongicarpus]|uniref:transmembrane protein 70, mitochondrial-like n=1 Tax=Hydractinia symbiolongicarpus TaxID=13093 RepID=UPI002550E7EC|nr:transmembrane protein 70, mitochondrial-like [Hydractinia symbiolongicarpus]